MRQLLGFEAASSFLIAFVATTLTVGCSQAPADRQPPAPVAAVAGSAGPATTAPAPAPPVMRPTIAQLADILERHPEWRLRFGGHTDNIGSADANLELSRARAAAVRDAIVLDRSGKMVDRLEADGFGATRPRESNDTPEGRARNRRVEASRIK